VTVEPPGKTDFCFDFGLPKGLCYPCMAEPMILSLERKFEDYSLGKEFDAGKIRDIVRLGAKHGFSIHSLTSQDRPLTHEDIFKIRDNALERKRRKKRKFFLLWR
jgi:hypothetical protein